MFAPAINRNPRRQQTARTMSLPAPVGGWNARDPQALMKEDEAVLLDNFFPLESSVVMRKGSANHATGMTGTIETLATWEGQTGTNKLFAAVGTNIYDASSAGAVGAAVVASMTNGRWQCVNLSVGGSSYLYMVNGADSPRLYDGTTWTAITGASSPAITGVTTTSLIHVNLFKRRLYFVETSSCSVWYLPVDSVGGAATELDFGPLMKRGGYMMAMGSWTVDAGEGVDDYAVFITSEGEAIVFKGSDPSSAADWALVGVYEVGRPIGRRCMVKFAGDILLITYDGLVPLSKALTTSRTSRIALTDKISEAMNDAAVTYGSVYGWQTIVYPEASMVLLNIPLSTTISQQFVMNSNTGAWCSFSGWNAACFATLRGVLYFGTANKVMKAWSGTADISANVNASGLQAFHYFGNRTQLKHWTEVRPILARDNNAGVLLGLNTDFDTTTPSGVPSFTATTSSVWDTTLWDGGTWGGDLSIEKGWQTPSISGTGYCAGLYLKASSNVAELRWIATDYVWVPGGVI
jgi:hypothetical protein